MLAILGTCKGHALIKRSSLNLVQMTLHVIKCLLSPCRQPWEKISRQDWRLGTVYPQAQFIVGP
jgi:hypothetical protein